MKRLSNALNRHLIAVLAACAFAVVAVSWVLDVFAGLKPIGTLPLIYDLCLAYLTGWFFHLLVVIIPERRKTRATMRTLRGQLMTVANNGTHLIRDLEFIGRCPERSIDLEHISKVCLANNYNDATRKFLAERLSVARNAYRQLKPFLGTLPHDVSIAIQVVDQQFINVSLGVPDHYPSTADNSGNDTSQPSDMRSPSLGWTLTSTTPIPKRSTLSGWATLIHEYYVATEAVRAAVHPFVKGAATQPEGVAFWINHQLNEPFFPFASYPPEAFTDVWQSDTPPAPPFRIVDN